MAIHATPIAVRHEATEWKAEIYLDVENRRWIRSRSRVVFVTELLSAESADDVDTKIEGGGKA